ncbi:MAG TPA: glycosyltransferase family 39 protein [Candidatus Obscuribacterales bacterium]
MPQITLAASPKTVQRPPQRASQPGTARQSYDDALRFVLPLLAVLAGLLVLYVAFAMSWTKFSRAEVFFAECAREMVAFNNMVTPLYQSKPFFDKPILVYWLIVAMYKTFGVTHLVARVPSMIAGLATVALTAIATRKLTSSDKTGLIAAICTGSSFMFFSFAYLCMSDMYLVLFDTLTLILLYMGTLQESKRTLLWLLAATSMGFAFVTKGPIGIVLPAISFVAFLALTKRLHFIKPLHVIAGAIIAGLIAVPWFFAAYKANGTWALAYFFIRENFQRYAAATYDTHKPVWFMLVSLLTGFLPWSIFLPGALSSFVRKFRGKAGWQPALLSADIQPKLYLWLWVATVTAFFSFSRGKCDYYVLPVYPAAAALVAIYLSEAAGKGARILTMTAGTICLVAGLCSPILLSIIAAPKGFESWWMLPLSLTACGAATVVSASSQRLTRAICCLFAAVCTGGAGFAWQALPSLSNLQPIDVYAKVMKSTPAYTKVGVHAALGHWMDELTFQVERDPVQLTDTNTITQFFAQGPAIALIPEKDYERALAESPQLRSLPLSVLDRREVCVHPLTPGYVLQRKGNLYDTNLLLVEN